MGEEAHEEVDEVPEEEELEAPEEALIEDEDFDKEKEVEEIIDELLDEEDFDKEEEIEKIVDELLEERPPIELKGPRLYGGFFSVLGLAFVILTILAFIVTVITLRWDMWINGAAEETIGDQQMLCIYLGTVGIVVCAVVSLVDVVYRHRKGC
jgi:hypothetical protein